MANTADWYKDYANVCKLARWLYEEMYLDSMTEILDYFEKPWKWSEEWAEMNADPANLEVPPLVD
jgi:hypothetical protein